MNENMGNAMLRYPTVIDKTVPVPSYQRHGSFVVTLMMDYAFHGVLVPNVASFQRNLILTFHYRNHFGFFGCFDQLGTVDGYDVVDSISIYCNRIVSLLMYLA